MGFPTLCQGPRNLFLYFFIYLSTREKCLSRGFYLSREDWIPVDVFSLCIVRRPFLFPDFGFWRTYKELFPGDFCFQGKDKSFSIFTRSLCALTFQFCCGSFTINLSRKAITFVHLVCVLSFIIWGVYFVISSGVYNRRIFHASQHAEMRLVFSAGCTGAFTLSQANIYRLGPSVRVVPDWKESLYSRKPTFVGLDIFVRVALQRVSECLKVSQSVSRVSQSVTYWKKLLFALNCQECYLF